MSLVGNLEDLSLGDIMQIISLSQKSGVLALKSEEGAGRIVFRAGLVHAACLEGRPDDLRALLVASGSIDETAFDAFAAHAEKVGCAVAELLVQKSDLSAEQIDELLRESVESAILEMFSWLAGDFSFDVRSQADAADPQVVLSTGVNAQYLAMEGMRIRDERFRDLETGPSDPNAETAPAESFPTEDAFFGTESLEVDNDAPERDGEVLLPPLEVDEPVSAADVLVSTILSNEDGSTISSAELDNIEPAGVQNTAEVAPKISTDAEPTDEVKVAGDTAADDGNLDSAPTAFVVQRPLVLVDPDVAVLEWAKAALQSGFARVHAFQQAEQGLARIRQYLIRGEFPVVLISTGIRIDSLSGIHGLSDFVSRLKTQAAKLTIIGLQEDDPDPQAGHSAAAATSSDFDGVVTRPGARSLRSEIEGSNPASSETFATAVRQLIGSKVDSMASKSTPAPGAEAGEIRHLRDATTKLQEASSRGEILPVVLDFASESFARVAILIVREEQVFAIAGRGIDALEVDPLGSSPPVSLQILDSGWVREVLETGKSAAGPPTTSADRDLLTRFGGVIPAAAYLGPIESSGSTVAIIYCDQGQGGAGTPPDTSGLEVVLQHAGLALDRAALERALWEVDAKTH